MQQQWKYVEKQPRAIVGLLVSLLMWDDLFFNSNAFIFKNPFNTRAACLICIVSDGQRSTKGESSRWAMFKKKKKQTKQEEATRWVWVVVRGSR